MLERAYSIRRPGERIGLSGALLILKEWGGRFLKVSVTAFDLAHVGPSKRISLVRPDLLPIETGASHE